MISDDNEERESVVVGMMAAAGAMFMFTLMNAFAKYLSADHSIIEIVFYRNVVACIPFLSLAFLFGQRDMLVIKSKPAFVGFRAVLGTVTLGVTFAAYAAMPMAETSALLFTASLFLPVLGVVILREPVGPYRWSAVVIGFVGVAIMARPGGNINTLGVLLALSAAFLQANMGVLLRHLGGHEKPATISFYFFVVGALISGLAMPFVGTLPSFSAIPLFLGVGLAGAAAQMLYAVALKNAPASIVAVFNYTSMIWAMLFGWLIWNDWPTTVVLIGAGVIIATSLLIAWRESRLGRSRPPTKDLTA